MTMSLESSPDSRQSVVIMNIRFIPLIRTGSEKLIRMECVATNRSMVWKQRKQKKENRTEEGVSMVIEVNKNIDNYKESVVLGLTADN